MILFFFNKESNKSNIVKKINKQNKQNKNEKVGIRKVDEVE